MPADFRGFDVAVTLREEVDDLREADVDLADLTGWKLAASSSSISLLS